MMDRLFMGTYQEPNLRIVGTKDLAFKNVTPEFLQKEFNEALAEQVAHALNAEVVQMFFNKFPQLPRSRGSGGDHNSSQELKPTPCTVRMNYIG